jgi:hypothetical protein
MAAVYVVLGTQTNMFTALVAELYHRELPVIVGFYTNDL